MRCSLLLLVLCILVACGAPRPAPSNEPASSEYLVRETRLVNNQVSVQLELPLEPGRKPAVIALAGDTRRLRRDGMVIVKYTVHWQLMRGPDPTPLPAGKGAGKWVLASPDARHLGERYLREVAATADTYVPAIVDWLQTVPEVDPQRIGMVGASTNGFITLQALAAEPRLRAVVAIAACADYPTFLRDSTMGMSGAPLTLAPDYAAWLREMTLLSDPSRAVHGALLMINRVADPLIPVACADETARVLRDAYAAAGAADRFEYIRIAEEGHGMGRAETEAAYNWLRRWLTAP